VELKTSVKLRDRVRCEPETLPRIRKAGSSLFAGGLGATTLAAFLQLLLLGGQGLNVTELIYTLVASLLGGVIYLFGWAATGVWKKCVVGDWLRLSLRRMRGKH